MELPKRARTVNWESGVLTLDGEKQFEVPELTVEIMEQLAGYTLVGFHVKSCCLRGISGFILGNEKLSDSRSYSFMLS